jgi:hypothetical protein
MFRFVHTVDHRIDSASLPFEERRILRRSAPERLGFDLPAPGMPILEMRAFHPPPPLRPATSLRVRLGLWLMAWGQRLAGPDIAS